jgi:hypothetical protein
MDLWEFAATYVPMTAEQEEECLVKSKKALPC